MIIEIIFVNNIELLLEIAPFEAVDKVLQCGSQELWFTSYKCWDCWEIKHIAFTCKSRFCNSCGKPLSDIWINHLISRRPKHLKYYHLSFTIPEELRNFFKRHRKALKLLPQVASNSVIYFFQKKYKCTPWILSVIHTFWAKLNRNPHAHLMISSWGLTDNGLYKNIGFLPYVWILESWKRYLLKHLNNRCSTNLYGDELIGEKRLLSSLFSQKNNNTWEDKSRYIHFSKKANNFEVVLSYIGRYLKRPIIAQSRILAYDGTDVTYSYKDKYDGETKIITVSAIDFIGYLIQHIPNKFFKMIYYSWIFVNRSKSKYLKIINAYYNIEQKMPRIAKNFRERIFILTWKDPLRCACWWCFHKYQIIIPWYKPKYFDSS